MMKDSTGGIQHGGDHYKKLPIQIIDFGQENGLKPMEYSVVKHTVRHADKNKMEDIKKAFHYLQMISLRDYGVTATVSYSDEEPGNTPEPTNEPEKSEEEDDF